MVKQTVKREDEMRKKKRLPLVSSSSSSADAIALGLSLAAPHWEMCSTELELPGGESLSFFFLFFLIYQQAPALILGRSSGRGEAWKQRLRTTGRVAWGRGVSEEAGYRVQHGCKEKILGWGEGGDGVGVWRQDERWKERKRQGAEQASRPPWGRERLADYNPDLIWGKVPTMPASCSDVFQGLQSVPNTHTHTPYAKQDAAAQEQRLWNWGYLWQLIKLEPQSMDEFILACCTALHNAGVTVSRSNRRKWLEPALTELNRARFMR